MVAASFGERGRRARELAGRYPFAAEMLRLYGALTQVQEQAFKAAQGDPPHPGALPRYVADRVLPGVVEATLSHGPRTLGEAVRERVAAGDSQDVVSRWLAGDDQPPVDRYLARASTAPVLEALGDGAGEACRGPRDERHCPVCGGLPQLSFIAGSGDDLVTAPRRLQCARCGSTWVFQRLTCASCGETDTPQLPVYSETERFPHVRVDACETCGRYLLTVDLRKDARAVPAVDELAALPLDLYAQERGLKKIVANVLEIG